jgi:hypothetical protein
VADQITLTIPREPDFHRVAHLVVGGLAARIDLTIESLEDLQLALDALLDRVGEDPSLAADGHLTVTMSLHDGELQTRVGPLHRDVLDELERDGGEGIDLRRVLDSTVDDVLVDADTVVLTKKVVAGG